MYAFAHEQRRLEDEIRGVEESMTKIAPFRKVIQKYVACRPPISPGLVLVLTYHAVGGKDEVVYKYAASLEMLSLLQLMQDDICKLIWMNKNTVQTRVFAMMMTRLTIAACCIRNWTVLNLGIKTPPGSVQLIKDYCDLVIQITNQRAALYTGLKKRRLIPRMFERKVTRTSTGKTFFSTIAPSLGDVMVGALFLYRTRDDAGSRLDQKAFDSQAHELKAVGEQISACFNALNDSAQLMTLAKKLPRRIHVFELAASRSIWNSARLPALFEGKDIVEPHGKTRRLLRTVFRSDAKKLKSCGTEFWKSSSTELKRIFGANCKLYLYTEWCYDRLMKRIEL